jgi:amino acid transporter
VLRLANPHTYDAGMATRPKEIQVAGRTLWTVLIGRPLRSSDASKEQINPFEGLSALSLDALTSVAYGPEAIIVVLAIAGGGALHLILPITVAIIVLLAILVVSYRQVIDAYPGGGGAYAVSRANLGANASLVAGAALIIDYTLTVAVSIAAGVASLTSAFPTLSPYTVAICLGILALITVLNLRGLGDSARAFLLPTFMFIIGLLAVIAVGLVHPLGLHEAQPGRSLLSTHGLQAVSVLLILKAFSAGCSALTGVEAIANGVPLFKEPRAKRAKRTELMLGLVLGAMLLGLAVLAHRWHIGPRSRETVLSQIMGMSVGRHWAYYIVSLTITVVLALAANTSFGGLPILGSLLARDNYLPHIFGLRGDRQVFNSGIWVLASLSALLLVAVGGNTNEMIPLFAIGVFTGFTLSQTGLVVHWWRERPPRWRYRAVVNGAGAIVTGVATIIFLVSKFTQGAWIVVLAVPLFIVLFMRINAYYRGVAVAIGIDKIPPAPEGRDTLVIVPIVNVSKLTSYAISEALSLGQKVIAISVIIDDVDANQQRESVLNDEWEKWNPGVPLHLLHTDFSSIVPPICEFIDEQRANDDRQIVVLIPVLVPSKLRYRILHNQLDLILSRDLRKRTDVVVARVQMPFPPMPPRPHRRPLSRKEVR